MTRLFFSGLALAAAIALSGCGAPGAPNEASPSAKPTQPASVGPAAHRVRVRAAAIPGRFHGVYDVSAEACGRPSEYRLTVSAGELRFHESLGAVRGVTIDSPDAVDVAADYQGEGQSWRAVHALRLSEGGGRLTITGEDTRTTRVRCGPGVPAAPAAAARWDSAASGEGAALFLVAAGRERRLTLFCPSGSGELVVNVPGFRPVGSEERMTFGAGGTAVALVADPRGDSGRGGVTGRGPLPAELALILAAAAGVAVNYGSQNSGPHPPPPPDLARAFLAGCRN